MIGFKGFVFTTHTQTTRQFHIAIYPITIFWSTFSYLSFDIRFITKRPESYRPSSRVSSTIFVLIVYSSCLQSLCSSVLGIFTSSFSHPIHDRDWRSSYGIYPNIIRYYFFSIGKTGVLVNRPVLDVFVQSLYYYRVSIFPYFLFISPFRLAHSFVDNICSLQQTNIIIRFSPHDCSI